MLQKPKPSGLTFEFLQLIPRRMAGSTEKSSKSSTQQAPIYIGRQHLRQLLPTAAQVSSHAVDGRFAELMG